MFQFFLTTSFKWSINLAVCSGIGGTSWSGLSKK